MSTTPDEDDGDCLVLRDRNGVPRITLEASSKLPKIRMEGNQKSSIWIEIDRDNPHIILWREKTLIPGVAIMIIGESCEFDIYGKKGSPLAAQMSYHSYSNSSRLSILIDRKRIQFPPSLNKDKEDNLNLQDRNGVSKIILNASSEFPMIRLLGNQKSSIWIEIDRDTPRTILLNRNAVCMGHRSVTINARKGIPIALRYGDHENQAYIWLFANGENLYLDPLLIPDEGDEADA